jgi:hypothetical protein
MAWVQDCVPQGIALVDTKEDWYNKSCNENSTLLRDGLSRWWPVVFGHQRQFLMHSHPDSKFGRGTLKWSREAAGQIGLSVLELGRVGFTTWCAREVAIAEDRRRRKHFPTSCRYHLIGRKLTVNLFLPRLIRISSNVRNQPTKQLEIVECNHPNSPSHYEWWRSELKLR